MSSKSRENTGRWSKEEHEVFIKGLRAHGKEWKIIASMVETRTVVQIRTHAQKYFQKLSKLGITNPIADIRAGRVPPFNGSKRPRDNTPSPRPGKSGSGVPRSLARARASRPRSASAPMPVHGGGRSTGSKRSSSKLSQSSRSAATSATSRAASGSPASTSVTFTGRRAGASAPHVPVRRRGGAPAIPPRRGRRVPVGVAARLRVPSTKEDAARGAVLSEWSQSDARPAPHHHHHHHHHHHQRHYFDSLRTPVRLERSMSVDDDSLMGRASTDLLQSVPVVELPTQEHSSSSTAFATLPPMSSYSDLAAEDYSIDSSHPSHSKVSGGAGHLSLDDGDMLPFGDTSPTGITDAFFFSGLDATADTKRRGEGLSRGKGPAHDNGRISPVPAAAGMLQSDALNWLNSTLLTTHKTMTTHVPAATTASTRFTKRQRTSYHIQHPTTTTTTAAAAFTGHSPAPAAVHTFHPAAPGAPVDSDIDALVNDLLA